MIATPSGLGILRSSKAIRAGKGAVPLVGSEMLGANVIDCPASPQVMDKELPENVAVKVDGRGPIVKSGYSCTINECERVRKCSIRKLDGGWKNGTS